MSQVFSQNVFKIHRFLLPLHHTKSHLTSNHYHTMRANIKNRYDALSDAQQELLAFLEDCESSWTKSWSEYDRNDFELDAHMHAISHHRNQGWTTAGVEREFNHATVRSLVNNGWIERSVVYTSGIWVDGNGEQKAMMKQAYRLSEKAAHYRYTHRYGQPKPAKTLAS